MHVQQPSRVRLNFSPDIKCAQVRTLPKNRSEMNGLPIQTFLISSDFRNFLFVELMEHMQKSGNG